MKYRIIALWRLLTCKSFWLVTENKKGKINRTNDDFYVPNIQCIIADAEDMIFTYHQQEENLKIVNQIVSE